MFLERNTLLNELVALYAKVLLKTLYLNGDIGFYPQTQQLS